MQGPYLNVFEHFFKYSNDFILLLTTDFAVTHTIYVMKGTAGKKKSNLRIRSRRIS